MVIDFNKAIKIADTHLLSDIVKLYDLNNCKITLIPPHNTGVNLVYTCEKENSKIIRISFRGNKNRNEYIAETEYVRYLYENGGSVSNVINSLNGNMVEELVCNNHSFFVCVFEKAKGKRFPDNGYKYREGVSINEYYYNSGKTLGKLHQLSKQYSPTNRRHNFLDKYTAEYIEKLIPNSLSLAKEKLLTLVNIANEIPKNKPTYGMIHADYNDGNYCIDYATGNLTVYDFDETCFSWYMLDIAQLWTNGFGWAVSEPNAQNRKKIMDNYFSIVLDGYRSQTELTTLMLEKLPLFLKIYSMETIIWEFENMQNNGTKFETDEELSYRLKCIEDDIPYWGFFHEIYSSEAPFEYEKRHI